MLKDVYFKIFLLNKVQSKKKEKNVFFYVEETISGVYFVLADSIILENIMQQWYNVVGLTKHAPKKTNTHTHTHTHTHTL